VRRIEDMVEAGAHVAVPIRPRTFAHAGGS
jgi:hypothetical protein